MDSTLRASLRLSKITFGDFVTPFNPCYIGPYRSLYLASIIL